MSHGAELLFLPCWILPFPWYFPSSGRGSHTDADTGQGSASTQGMDTIRPEKQPWLQIQLPKQQVFVASAPQACMAAEINLMRKRRSPSSYCRKPKCDTAWAQEVGTFEIKHLQVPSSPSSDLPKSLLLTEIRSIPNLREMLWLDTDPGDRQLHFVTQRLRTSDEEGSGASPIDPACDTEDPIHSTSHNLCFQPRDCYSEFSGEPTSSLKTFFLFFKSSFTAMKRSTSKRGVKFCSLGFFC